MKNKSIRPSTQSCMGTSFHGNTVKASRAQLKSVLGMPTYVNRDVFEKTQHEWVCEILGHVFTVYDWKEHRRVKASEPIEWHIGGGSRVVTERAASELGKLLEK